MEKILLIVILIVIIINYFSIKEIKKKIENKSFAEDIKGFLSSMHDSLLSEIQIMNEKIDDNALVESEGLDDEELYKKSKQIILEEKRCSASLLQKKLHIGYAKAFQITNKLEAGGFVGSLDGSIPRKVYIDKILQSDGLKL